MDEDKEKNISELNKVNSVLSVQRFKSTSFFVPTFFSALLVGENKFSHNLLYGALGSIFFKIDSSVITISNEYSNYISSHIDKLDKFINDGIYDATDEINEKKEILNFIEFFRYGQNITGKRIFSYQILDSKNSVNYWGINSSPSMIGAFASISSLVFKKTRAFGISYALGSLMSYVKGYEQVIALDKELQPKKLCLFSSTKINYSVGTTPKPISLNTNNKLK